MTTTDVENLSYAKLKEQHDELVKAMQDQPPDDLARRYVQARTDAKARDEKMSEQGKTITELQLAIKALRKQCRDECEEVARQAVADRSRLKAEALRNHAALNGAAKLLNDAIAAQRVDDADTTGE